MYSFVDDPVLTDSESSQPGELAFENRSGEGLGGEAIDRRHKTTSVVC